MARKNSRGLMLTFHKPTKRWCKVVGGKRLYFGTGGGVSDRKSYQSALTRYQEWQESRRADTKRNDDLTANRELSCVMNQALNIVNGQLDKQGQFLLVQIFKSMSSFNEFVIEDEEAGVTTHLNKGKPNRTVTESVPQLVDRYREELKRRYERTQESPSIRRRERLGGSAFRNLNHSLDVMVEQFTASGLKDFRDVKATEAAVVAWRMSLEDAVAKGDIKGSTVGARTKAVNPFFKWAWKERHIEEVPRTLSELTSKYTPVSSAKPLDLDDVHRLWDAASGEMKCWIALALNCGFYAIDIATLQSDHLVMGDKYIARLRNKTTIPTKHLLWPVTRRLLKRYRDGDQERLLSRKHGLPLVVEKPETGQKYDGIANRFSRLTEKAGVKACFSQLRDTSAGLVEKFAVTSKGMIDTTLTSQFLGHADSRMAKFYLKQKPELMETTKLDRIMRKLNERYALSD